MLYTGQPTSAQDTFQLGAIESLVEPSEVLTAARSLATVIAKKSPVAVRLAKEALNGIELLDPLHRYCFEQGFTLELYASSDSDETRAAFVEKRSAEFSED